MNRGGPPMKELSPQVPMQAQALLMQPQAIQMFAPLQGFNLLTLFYFQLPFMLKKNQVNKLQKNTKKFLTFTGVGLIVGFIANVQVKRLYMGILKWPLYARVPLRLGIMALPLLGLSSFMGDKLDNVINMSNDLTERKNMLLMTGDLQAYYGVDKKQKK